MSDPVASEYDPPRPRLTANERRKTILQAARFEFARLGYYGASTASIARTAGCSEPMLYKHFAGKLALFMAALRDAVSRLHSTFEAAGQSDTTVVDQTRAFLDEQLDSERYVELMRLRRHAATVDEPEIRELMIVLERQTSHRIAIAVRDGIEQGVFRPDVDPDYVVACWTGIMHVACHHDSLDPGSFARHARHAEALLASLGRTASAGE